jgi:hypothetical protein
MPKLRVTAWRERESAAQEVPPDASRAPPVRVPEEIDAPLDTVNSVGDSLYFRYARPVRLRELGHVELHLEGEPLAPLPKWDSRSGDRPLSDRRNYIGMQVGGTGYLHVVYRRRLFDPLLFEVGALPFVLNGGGLIEVSAGLLVDVPLTRRFSVYAGGGASAAIVFGGEGEDGASTTDVSFVYGRLGIAVRLGVEQRDQLGLEGDLWNGKLSDEGHDRHILWVVPGFVWMHAM